MWEQFHGEIFVFQFWYEFFPAELFYVIWGISCSLCLVSGGGSHVLLRCCQQSVCLSRKEYHEEVHVLCKCRLFLISEEACQIFTQPLVHKEPKVGCDEISRVSLPCTKFAGATKLSPHNPPPRPRKLCAWIVARHRHQEDVLGWPGNGTVHQTLRLCGQRVRVVCGDWQMFLSTENCALRVMFLRQTACHRGWSPLPSPLPSLLPKLPNLVPNPQPRGSCTHRAHTVQSFDICVFMGPRFQAQRHQVKNPPARHKETPGIIQRPLVTIHKHLGTPAIVVCGGPLHRVKSPETSERCRTVRAPCDNTLQECSQTCCPGGSQACSPACSWRAHSCGPCGPC